MATKRIKLKVASPCGENWDKMEGDDGKRFCGSCSQFVYELSYLSQDELEQLIRGRKRQGLRTCGRFYQRADGTVLTSDCSVGKSRKRKRRLLAVAGAAGIATATVGAQQFSEQGTTSSERRGAANMGLLNAEPVQVPGTGEILSEPEPEPEFEPERVMMGEMMYEPDNEPAEAVPAHAIKGKIEIDTSPTEMLGNVAIELDETD